MVLKKQTVNSKADMDTSTPIDVVVKPIINPHTSMSINIRHLYSPRRILVKIIMTSVADLGQMQTELSRVVVPGHYRVGFNLKNTPEEIRNNHGFKTHIIKSLIRDAPAAAPGLTSGTSELANLVVGHIEQHGGAPNFRVLVTDKQRRKVVNYIRATIGRNGLTDDQCLEIARLVAVNLPPI